MPGALRVGEGLDEGGVDDIIAKLVEMRKAGKLVYAPYKPI